MSILIIFHESVTDGLTDPVIEMQGRRGAVSVSGITQNPEALLGEGLPGPTGTFLAQFV